MVGRNDRASTAGAAAAGRDNPTRPYRPRPLKPQTAVGSESFSIRIRVGEVIVLPVYNFYEGCRSRSAPILLAGKRFLPC